MDALKELLYKMADDELIIGHRNSEWTGLGPMLEEDIAFSSMAQDQIGHAFSLYTILHEDLGEPTPDLIAFTRKETEFKCCHLVEMPIGEFDFSLVRHFFFDHAEALRYQMLERSVNIRLAQLARKVRGEIKYHLLHADTWMRKLGNATEESHARMQTAIDETYPLALGIFEEGPFEAELKAQGFFDGEKVLQQQWQDTIEKILPQCNLTLPLTNSKRGTLGEVEGRSTSLGGRKGYHTEYLAPLLKEMSEVFSIDPDVEW